MHKKYYESFHLTFSDKLVYLGAVLLAYHCTYYSLLIPYKIASHYIYDTLDAIAFSSTFHSLLLRLPLAGLVFLINLFFIVVLFSKKPPIFKRKKEKTYFGKTPVFSKEFAKKQMKFFKDIRNRKRIIISSITAVAVVAVLVILVLIGVAGFFERTELGSDTIKKYNNFGQVIEEIPYSEVESYHLKAYWDVENALETGELKQELTMTLLLKSEEELEFELSIDLCDDIEKIRKLEKLLQNAKKSVDGELLGSTVDLYDLNENETAIIYELFDKQLPDEGTYIIEGGFLG